MLSDVITDGVKAEELRRMLIQLNKRSYGDRQLTTTPSSYCGFVSVIHSDMVYDPEYTTGLYQREAQTLWIVTSSSECYI